MQFQCLVLQVVFRQHANMMMKPFGIFAVACLAVLAASVLAMPGMAQSPDAKSFTITLNGQAVPIDPGETLTIKGSDGKDITLQLARNPEVLFKGDGFAFRHSSDYQVSTSALADDISQHLIVTGNGTLVLVQAYRAMDPTTLNQFMLDQITGDDVRAGGKITQSPHERMVGGGLKLSGLKATVKTGSAEAEVEVMSAKTGNGGIIAVSRLDLDNLETDRAFVEKFWSTLVLE